MTFVRPVDYVYMCMCVHKHMAPPDNDNSWTEIEGWLLVAKEGSLIKHNLNLCAVHTHTERERERECTR